MPQKERNQKVFSVKVYDKKHLANLNKRMKRVQQILNAAVRRAVGIASNTGYEDLSKDFRFDDFPAARREIDALLGELSANLTLNVESANSEAWGLANLKNDAMADSILAATGIELPRKATGKWYNKNERALKAFQRRVSEGMNLSSDVWNLAQFKGELELSLEMGLGRGKSAAELSRDVRSCLKYPNKLFRRVRDEKGVLRLSRAAREFHPGQGVYRSSYKNALRLTATETNMAYRTADNMRWNQMDFVLGQHIEPSRTNHPVIDICDELKGDYPKDFKFVGWHPFCKCFSVPKLASKEEFIKYQKAILDGEDVSDWKFSGEVKDVPDNFKGWMQDNLERISNAKSLPYFIKDNPKYNGLTITTTSEAPAPVRKTPKEIAAERHASRTPADIRRIQDLADEHTYGKTYVDNVHKIEAALGVERGKRMNHADANTGRVNPDYGKRGYNVNCSTCSGTYILRRMGFDVEALPNTKKNPIVQSLSYGMTTWDKWVGGRKAYHRTDEWMAKTGTQKMDEAAYRKFLNRYTKKPGVYEFNVGYGSGGGHSTLLERKADGTLVRIEQQTTSKYATLDSLLKYLTKNPASVRGVMRVDNAKFNPQYAGIVRKVKKRNP